MQKIPCDVQVGINNCGKFVELFVCAFFVCWFCNSFSTDRFLITHHMVTLIQLVDSIQ